MRALILYTRNEPDMRVSGEAKKILMQMDGLKKNGIDCDLVYHNRNSRFNKILIRTPFIPIYSNSFINNFISQARDYDCVYIRKYIFDVSFLKLVKALHSMKKKVIVEIPTYPYDLEWKGIVDFPILAKDKIGRSKLFKYVDRFVTFSSDDSIFGVKCIGTSNGIDEKTIPLRKFTAPKEKCINFLGVANVESWHGFDRLILGMKNYYSQTDIPKEVYFHIVGGGAAIPELKRMAEELSISKYVVFHGPLYGKQLDEMFDLCEIGIGSLGMYRINLFNGYTLKLREYSARGIPFIYAYNDDLIEHSGINYCIKFPNDGSPVDVSRVLNFCGSLYEIGYEPISKSLRKAAIENMTWKKQMQPVAQYMKI